MQNSEVYYEITDDAKKYNRANNWGIFDHF